MDIIVQKLEKGNYIELEAICREMVESEIRDIILKVAYETESINVYAFVNYMKQKEKKDYWIKLAIDVMLGPLCFIEGAYSVALFHARELLNIERSVENLERILFFYNIPEKLVDEKEAKIIAKEILVIDSANAIALQI